MTEKITILGSTGSIGTQALETCLHLGISVEGICAGSSIDILEEQIRKFSPKYCAVSNEERAKDLRLRVGDTSTKVIAGKDSACEISAITDSDTVLNAITGIAGLMPTITAIEQKKNIAIANKETLVAAGDIVNAKLQENGVSMLPVDSEHCAIHMCLDGRKEEEISKLILTASGGTFFGKSRKELEKVKPEQALKHPNWSMGRKITIDSSSLVNKGLELIEAMKLFGVTEDKIDVLVHRESIVHSMVSFVDGSVMAQMASPDMRLCIQHALTYPEKKRGLTQELDLTKISKLSFYEVDNEAFPSIMLARRAARMGGVAPAVFNGANEACVDLFLSGKIGFCEIFELLEYALDSVKGSSGATLSEILEADKHARALIVQKASK